MRQKIHKSLFFEKKAGKNLIGRKESEMEEKLSVLCVKVREKPKRIEVEGNLGALQQAVGGYIEAVYPYEDPVALIVNEEGKLNGLPLNRALWDEDNKVYDIVAGSFLIVGLGESEFTSLTPALMKKYEELFRCPEAFIKIGEHLTVIPMPEPQAQRHSKERGEAR